MALNYALGSQDCIFHSSWWPLREMGKGAYMAQLVISPRDRMAGNKLMKHAASNTLQRIRSASVSFWACHTTSLPAQPSGVCCMLHRTNLWQINEAKQNFPLQVNQKINLRSSLKHQRPFLDRGGVCEAGQQWLGWVPWPRLIASKWYPSLGEWVGLDETNSREWSPGRRLGHVQLGQGLHGSKPMVKIWLGGIFQPPQFIGLWWFNKLFLAAPPAGVKVQVPPQWLASLLQLLSGTPAVLARDLLPSRLAGDTPRMVTLLPCSSSHGCWSGTSRLIQSRHWLCGFEEGWVRSWWVAVS